MFAMFHRLMARPKTALPDFAGAAQVFIRWLSLPRRRTGEPSLQLLESMALTAQASVALIRFERETLVLGVTPHNVTLLARNAVAGASGETGRRTGNPTP
jgi:flagellar biogenesis protein FliO